MRIDLEKIKELYMQMLLTQTELADKANVSRATVSAVMNRGTCSKGTLIKLANALQVEPQELLMIES